MTDGKIRPLGLMPRASNYTFLVELTDGDVTMYESAAVPFFRHPVILCSLGAVVVPWAHAATAKASTDATTNVATTASSARRIFTGRRDAAEGAGL